MSLALDCGAALRASVIVPVFNALGRIEALVDLLAAQVCGFDWDLTFVDSGSTDGTLEWLASRSSCSAVPLRVVELGSEGFDHGDARNLGAALTRGEVIVFLTDDARPVGAQWLGTVVQALGPSGADAVYCRNLVPAGTPAWATVLAERDPIYHGSCPEPPGRERGLPTPDSIRAKAHYCDTASAILRRVWERHPYPRAGAGEDMLLARALRAAGFDVRQLDCAPVEHAHVYGADQLRRRALLDGQFNMEAFGRVVVPPATECDTEVIVNQLLEECEPRLELLTQGLLEFEQQRKILRDRLGDFVEGARAGASLALGRRWNTVVLGTSAIKVGLVHDDSQRAPVAQLCAELEHAGITAHAIDAADLECATGRFDLIHVLVPLSEEQLRESAVLRTCACMTVTRHGWRMHLFGYLPAPHSAHDRHELTLPGAAHPLDLEPGLAAARLAFRYRQLACMSRATEAFARWGCEADQVIGEVRREGQRLCTLGPGPAEIRFDIPSLGSLVNELEITVEYVPEDLGTTRCAIAAIDGREQGLVGSLEVEVGLGHAIRRMRLRVPTLGCSLTLSNLTPAGERTVCRVHSVRMLRSSPAPESAALFVEPDAEPVEPRRQRVAVVIVTLDGGRKLARCLAALERSNYPRELLDITVVVNGAFKVGLCWKRLNRYLEKRLGSGVRRIPLIPNVGFARGANLGACEAGEAPVLVFLNDDAEVAPDFIGELVRPIESGKCAATAARMNLPDGTPEFFGGAGSFQGLAFGGPQDPALAEHLDRPRKSLFACGGAMAIAADVFRSVGGFDEDFFAYYDDLDIGWRLWLLGHEVYYVPSAICTHLRSATSATFPPETVRLLQVRNALLTCIKNLGDDALRATLPSLLALGVRRLWIQARRPDISGLRIEQPGARRRMWRRPFRLPRMAMADLVALQDVLGDWDKWMAKRAAVQSSRKRLDSEVLPLFLDPLRCVEGEAEYIALQASLEQLFDLSSVFRALEWEGQE